MHHNENDPTMPGMSGGDREEWRMQSYVVCEVSVGVVLVVFGGVE